MTEPIYLDHNATTPLAPEVVEAMGPALREGWGNPSSDHTYGKRSRLMIDDARERVAALLGCAAGEIVFTSGGTESDNAAIIGVAEARERRGRHIVTSAIEHPAVEEACRHLERRGWTVTRVGVDPSGRVGAADVEAVLGDHTALVSIMHANNETGVLQPVRTIADVARRRGAIVHTDAAQSVGKVPTRVDDLGVDLLTVAGHKLYGPKGIGALYVREGTPLSRFLHGAGHERGRRAGTENTASIVGLGTACELALRERDERERKLAALRDRLTEALRRRIPDLVVHGSEAQRLPNTLSVALPGVASHRLLDALEGVATAAGAACHAGIVEPSGVLRAMGVPDALAICTLRLTVGRPTTREQIDRAVERIADAAEKVRDPAAR